MDYTHAMGAIEWTQQLVERSTAELNKAQAASDVNLARDLGGLLEDLKDVYDTAPIIEIVDFRVVVVAIAGQACCKS